MERQKMKERVDVHGHDAMPAILLVHLVVIGDTSVSHIQYPGVGDGHSIGIAPDVLEHLADTLGGRLGMDDPVLIKAVLADRLGNDDILLFQPAGEQTYEAPSEFATHSGHGKEERRASASVEMMPHALRANTASRHDAMQVRMVIEIGSPRMEDGSHASEKPLICCERADSRPCGLEDAVVEVPLVSHSNPMQAMRHCEDDMEVLRGDDFLPSVLNPLLPFLVLALGAMTVPAAVIADSDIAAVRTHLHMPTQRTGSALRHVGEGSHDRADDLMASEEFLPVAPDDLTDVVAGPHLGLGGKRTSIGRTCLFGSKAAA